MAESLNSQLGQGLKPAVHLTTEGVTWLSSLTSDSLSAKWEPITVQPWGH